MQFPAYQRSRHLEELSVWECIQSYALVVFLGMPLVPHLPLVGYLEHKNSLVDCTYCFAVMTGKVEVGRNWCCCSLSGSCSLPETTGVVEFGSLVGRNIRPSLLSVLRHSSTSGSPVGVEDRDAIIRQLQQSGVFSTAQAPAHRTFPRPRDVLHAKPSSKIHEWIAERLHLTWSVFFCRSAPLYMYNTTQNMISEVCQKRQCMV